MKRDKGASARIAALAVALACIAGCTGAYPGQETEPTAGASRQAEVAQRGRSVMPFDLDRTTHRFAKTDTGGVQTVVSDDPGDAAQVTLVRQHLLAEAERMRRGDFTDPARIHGSDMPGLAALSGSAGRIAIDYVDTADGAQITYSTGDSSLVTALHEWFEAQLSDHGDHATQE